MKRYAFNLLLLVAFASLLGCGPVPSGSSVSYGGRGSLQIGSPAPPLAIEAWFQGDAVEKIESGKVYVIEFWATWCGPCLMNMPHMSELQEQYRDEATFIGVTDESAAKVRAFLATESTSGSPWSSEITYRLGTDLNEGMYTNYMAAANQMGIPTAFIIGKGGTVDWIGHPADLDEALATAVKAVN